MVPDKQKRGDIVFLRLPVCPYCHAVYHYKEASDLKGKTETCYHCRKTFLIRRRGPQWLFLGMVSLCLIGIDVLIFFSSGNLGMSLLILTVLADVLCVTAAVWLLPLTIRLVPEKKKK